MLDDKPYLWIIDSERQPLAQCLEAFDAWADILYLGPEQDAPDWELPPHAIFFSSEIRGGADGESFRDLSDSADGIPLLAVAKVRSLTQALAFFRAGATDYLPLPLEEEEVRERLLAALERAERLAMPSVMVELEPVDGDPGEISLSLAPTPAGEEPEEDILAGISGEVFFAPEKSDQDGAVSAGDESPPPAAAAGETDEPEPVDGLPIPTLWEELPCGLMVFDSRANLVFSNRLGLTLFGYESLAELQDALESRRHEFAAHAANHKPLPDNQWPHVLAEKTKMARSAVLSLEKPDKRRLWLRIDCLPHLSEGKITRLSMTLVNLTGELPPLAASSSPATEKREKTKARGKRKKK